jgi:ornithine--oxo-acid transaminase
MTAALASDLSHSLYQSHVNPQWAKLLDLLEMNVQYDHCEGVELHVADGRTILDFLSGYGVHNAGHNHPRIIAALREELERRGPAMLQSQAMFRTRRANWRHAFQNSRAAI